MQRIISLCLLLSLCFSRADAQTKNCNNEMLNAYYLAKTLAQQSRLLSAKKISTNADSNLKIVSAIRWYATPDLGRKPDYLALRNKPYITRIDTALSKAVLTFTDFLKAIDSSTLGSKKLVCSSDTLRKLKKVFIGYEDTLKNDLAAIGRLKNDIDSLKTVFAALDTNAPDVTTQRFEINTGIETFTAQIATLREKYITDTTFYKNTYTQLANSFAKLSIGCIQELVHVNGGKATYFFTDDDVVKELRANNINIIQQSSTEAASPFAIKMPSETEMIDAVAIYLVNRVKQETVLWFFDQLQNNSKLYPIIDTLFPETMRLLKSRDAYDMPNMGSAWQYALSKDFVYMPYHLLQSNWIGSRSNTYTSMQPFLVKTWDIALLVEQRYNVKDIITKLYLQLPPDSNKQAFTYPSLVTLLYAIQTELFVLDNECKPRPLRYQDLVNMSTEELLFMIDLMDMRYDHVFSRLIKIEPNSVPKIRLWLANILMGYEQFEKISSLQQQDAAANVKKFSYDVYNVWQFLSGFLSTVQPDSSIMQPAVHDMSVIIAQMQKLQEIYGLIQQKNFYGAMESSLELAKTYVMPHDSNFFYLDINLARKKFTANGLKLYEKSYATDTFLKAFDKRDFRGLYFDSYSIKVCSPNCKLKHVHLSDIFHFSGNKLVVKKSIYSYMLVREDLESLQKLRKLSAFLNDVSQADGSKSLSKVVESYAMPPGSYKQKRNNWYSIDLNAFVGAYVGTEKVYRRDTVQKLKPGRSSVYGLTAPIGLSFSKTWGRKVGTDDEGSNDAFLYSNSLKIRRNAIRKRTKLTTTLSLTIIDIGAVVSYRFDHSEGDLPQSVKWSQLVSPGAHLQVGIPGLPLVGSIGVVHTPELRRFSQEDRQFNATRFYFGLLFDLPVMNLHTTNSIVLKK